MAPSEDTTRFIQISNILSTLFLGHYFIEVFMKVDKDEGDTENAVEIKAVR